MLGKKDQKRGAKIGVAVVNFPKQGTAMVQLADIQKQTKELSEEDRKGLVAYLLHGMSGLPSGPDDEEVERREAEMNSGSVIPISHGEFLAQVGRGSR